MEVGTQHLLELFVCYGVLFVAVSFLFLGAGPCFLLPRLGLGKWRQVDRLGGIGAWVHLDLLELMHLTGWWLRQIAHMDHTLGIGPAVQPASRRRLSFGGLSDGLGFGWIGKAIQYHEHKAAHPQQAALPEVTLPWASCCQEGPHCGMLLDARQLRHTIDCKPNDSPLAKEGKMALPELNPDEWNELRAIVDGQCSSATDVRMRHGQGESYYPGAPPAVVAFPRCEQEVVELVRWCQRWQRPVVPFGAGTSLEGQLAAPAHGLCVDLSRMDQVLAVHEADLDCRVQAGVRRETLNAYLRDTGLFFPVDPGADATIGGMAATRASGTNAVRYGTMRENVLGLRVVLADGQVAELGCRARKSAAGYDLVRLFVGSEGTLGIITEVTLRLYGRPAATAVAVAAFATLAGAVETVVAVVQSGVAVARIELLDELQMEAIVRHSQVDLPIAPTLFLEFHGMPAALKEEVALVGALARDHGAFEMRWEHEEQAQRHLWRARHQAFYAALALRPGCKGWSTDVAVPISALTACILETKADLATSGLVAPLVGHAGEGNFHLLLLVSPEATEEMRRAKALHERLIRRALAMGGTCTGEHGVGLGKRDYMPWEHGEAGVALMRSIKQALDPANLFNPDKVVMGPMEMP